MFLRLYHSVLIFVAFLWGKLILRTLFLFFLLGFHLSSPGCVNGYLFAAIQWFIMLQGEGSWKQVSGECPFSSGTHQGAIGKNNKPKQKHRTRWVSCGGFTRNVVATQIFFIFTPKIGEDFQFDYFFQRGWNHQLEVVFVMQTLSNIQIYMTRNDSIMFFLSIRLRTIATTLYGSCFCSKHRIAIDSWMHWKNRCCLWIWMVGYWKNPTRENIFEKGSRVVVAERTIPLSFYFFAVILPEYCFVGSIFFKLLHCACRNLTCCFSHRQDFQGARVQFVILTQKFTEGSLPCRVACQTGSGQTLLDLICRSMDFGLLCGTGDYLWTQVSNCWCRDWMDARDMMSPKLPSGKRR